MHVTPAMQRRAQARQAQLAEMLDALVGVDGEPVSDAIARSLTAWETTFLASVREQWTRASALSAKQADILQDLYTRKGPA